MSVLVIRTVNGIRIPTKTLISFIEVIEPSIKLSIACGSLVLYLVGCKMTDVEYF